MVKPMLELLAGVPTVVFGYFALTFFTPDAPAATSSASTSPIFNALAAGIVIGVMIIPTIASIAEDAMTAVPQALREGAYALGATKLQVVAAGGLPGGAVGHRRRRSCSAISRAVGETMIVLIAAGQAAALYVEPGEPMETMTAFIAATGQGRHRRPARSATRRSSPSA